MEPFILAAFQLVEKVQPHVKIGARVAGVQKWNLPTTMDNNGPPRNGLNRNRRHGGGRAAPARQGRRGVCHQDDLDETSQRGAGKGVSAAGCRPRGAIDKVLLAMANGQEGENSHPDTPDNMNASLSKLAIPSFTTCHAIEVEKSNHYQKQSWRKASRSAASAQKQVPGRGPPGIVRSGWCVFRGTH
jgi:hypothetical protein